MLKSLFLVLGLAGALAVPANYDRLKRDLGSDLTGAFSSMAKPVGDIYVSAMKNTTNAMGEGLNEMSKATKEGLDEVAAETKSKDGSGTDFSSLFKTDSSSKPSFSSRSSFNKDDDDWPSRHSKNFGDNSGYHRSSLFDNDSSFGSRSSVFDKNPGFGGSSSFGRPSSSFGSDPFKSSFGNDRAFGSSFGNNRGFGGSSSFGNDRPFGSSFSHDSGFGGNSGFGSSSSGRDRTTEPYGKYW